MWRFLRNRRLILRLHYFQGTQSHIRGSSRGGPCDSVTSCFHMLMETVTVWKQCVLATLSTLDSTSSFISSVHTCSFRLHILVGL